jgi:hypothetical protein
MSVPFASLSEENHEQIRKYLRFLRNKKDAILRSLQREIEDIRSDRLTEDMYSRDDMNEFVDFLTSSIKSQVGGDVSSVVNMSALALNQLLESSQDKGVELELETSALENQSVLEAVEKMSLDAMPKGGRRAVNLTSFRDEAKAMREETQRIEETNLSLQHEVSLLRQRLGQVERTSSSLADSKDAESARSKAQSKELERALEEAKEENMKRVAETTQFQQMRKIMQSQSAKIRELRTRLQMYEPDAVKNDDDDA